MNAPPDRHKKRDRRMDGRTARQTQEERPMDGWTHRQTDTRRETDGWMDGRSEGLQHLRDECIDFLFAFECAETAATNEVQTIAANHPSSVARDL